jgi:hypothetical protein
MTTTGDADVDDPAVPHVINYPKRLRGNLENQRTITEINPEPGVWRVVICSKPPPVAEGIVAEACAISEWTEGQSNGYNARICECKMPISPARRIGLMCPFFELVILPR